MSTPGTCRVLYVYRVTAGPGRASERSPVHKTFSTADCCGRDCECVGVRVGRALPSLDRQGEIFSFKRWELRWSFLGVSHRAVKCFPTFQRILLSVSCGLVYVLKMDAEVIGRKECVNE
jgi:hypothetical protein